VRVRLLYFAAARERVGCARETLELSGDAWTVGALLEVLAQKHAALGPLLPHLRVAVDQRFVELSTPLAEEVEVALIPPVAGGSGRFQVREEPLRLDEVVRVVSGPGRGGVVTFTGAVRDHSHGKRVTRLEYEAYAPMAERVFAQIADEVAARWPQTQLAISHRVGTLVPGDLAVVIAAAAPHRKEAFLACEHAIDRLKEDAPIWKREVFEDGAVWVGLGP
jgi:molybdopterin synthase catalytic subunit